MEFKHHTKDINTLSLTDSEAHLLSNLLAQYNELCAKNKVEQGTHRRCIFARSIDKAILQGMP